MWKPGDVAVRREILHGKVWSIIPTRVVVDEPGLLAVFIEPGTRLEFPEHPYPHSWNRPDAAWRGHGKLMLHRPQDAYSVDLFWKGDNRRFQGWYLNLQAPYTRTTEGFDTLDHALDYWQPACGPWEQRDLDEFEQKVAHGKYSAEEAQQILLQAKEIEQMLDDRATWWDPKWADWTP